MKPGFMFRALWLLLTVALANGAAQAQGRTDPRLVDLPLPVKCDLGKECFFQNLPDLDPSSGVTDSFCGKASYDGHKGTDLRIRSLADMKRGFSVLAVLPGTVRAIRDEIPDRIMRNDAHRKAVENLECGNGLVIDHGDGLETQYCHMRKGSVRVNAGDEIKVGDILGRVGTSGLSQFPHLHLSIRKDGKEIDPNTGFPISAGKCVEADSNSKGRSAWQRGIATHLEDGMTRILQVRLSGSIPDHDELVVDGGPAIARAGNPVTVGWAWFINLEKGDRVAMVLTRDGETLAETDGEPLAKPQAAYSQFVGKRREVEAGNYELSASVIRDGKTIISETRTFAIE